MDSYIQQQLGNKIRKYRKLKGLSQEQLAEEIGIATNTLSSIERGNAFIKIFGVTPQEMFTFPNSISEEDRYTYILKKLDLLKADAEKMQIVYNVVKGLV